MQPKFNIGDVFYGRLSEHKLIISKIDTFLGCGLNYCMLVLETQEEVWWNEESTTQYLKFLTGSSDGGT
jgi:hypothetical protein